MNSTFKDIIDYCRMEAYNSVMLPTESSVWRSFCREYSTKFHTPLLEVEEKLDPEHVIRHVLESQMEGIELEEHIESMMDTIYTVADPNYSAEKAREQQDFDERTVKEEEERKARGESLFDYLRRNSVKKKVKAEMAKPALPPGAPTKGSVDLSHLEKEESGGPGFKDDDS